MNQAIQEALTASRPGPVLIDSSGGHSGAQVISGADNLARRLAQEGHRIVAVRADSAAELLRVLVATEAAGCSLFIVHRSSPRQIMDDLAANYSVSALIDQDYGEEFKASASSDSGPATGERYVYLMTSGTTGPPKIAKHTIGSLTGRIRPNPRGVGARWLITYPPTSFAGLQVVLTAILTQGTMVEPLERTPSSMIKAAEQHKVTHMSGTPSLWRSIWLALGPDGALPHLTQITLGGEAVDQAILDRLGARFPQARISHIYASTEAGALFSVHDGREGFPAEWLEMGIDDVGLKICDGLLTVRSPREMAGYVSGHPQPLSEDGWLSTGDRVQVRGDRVVFMGRNDRRINIGGFNVFPEEVESVLMAVDEILEARVAPAPSPLLGNALLAEIVCTPGADIKAVRVRALKHLHSVLEPYKVPRTVRVVDHVSTTAFTKKNRQN